MRKPNEPANCILLCASSLLAFLGFLAFPASLGRAEEVLIDSMGSQSPWVVTPGLRPEQNALEAVKKPVRTGSKESLQFSYDLEKISRPGICWRGDPMPGRATSCSFWLYGDDSGHRLAVRFEDAAGQMFDLGLERIDWKGWQQVQVPLEEHGWNPLCRFGEEPAAVHWPITLRDIFIVRGNDRILQGTVAFSELRAKCVIRPLDRVVMRLYSGVPANVFYAPASATLKLTLSNPTDTSFDGRLEVVLEDWRGRSFQVDQGPLQLAKQETLTRDVQLPIRRLGSYRAWVRFVVGSTAREACQRLAVSSKKTVAAEAEPKSPFAVGLSPDRDSAGENPAEEVLGLLLARQSGVKWARVDALGRMLGRGARVGTSAEEPCWVAGQADGGAVRLTPGPATLGTPDSPSLDRPCETGELTVAVQMKFLSFDKSGTSGDILRKGEAKQSQYRLSYLAQEGRLSLAFGDAGGGWGEVWCARHRWQLDRWYTIVVNHRRSDRRVEWWVDGVPAGENQTLEKTLVANAKMLEIGGNLDIAIDDLAIYDRALAPQDLAAAKPVAHWNFDEKHGARAADSSGNRNHAFLPPSLRGLEESRRAGITSYAYLLDVPQAARQPTQDAEPASYGMPRLDEWSATVEAAVARYAAKGVHVWEVWNEPNRKAFWSPEPDPDQYYRLLVASYQAIKKADPQATVLGCSLAGPLERQPEEACRFAAEVFHRGGGKVMDAIAIHPDRRFSPETSDYIGAVKAVRALATKYGCKLPIWISGISWANDIYGCSEAWSAKMLPRAYVLAIAEGVRSIAWRDLRDQGDDRRDPAENCGLLWHDFTPKPAYFALRTTATELAGLSLLRAIPTEEPCTLMLFGNATRRTLVAWAHQGEIPLALHVGNAQRLESVNLMGNVDDLPVHDGAAMLLLGDAPVFIRDVPAELEAVVPLSGSPAVLKLIGGQSSRIRVTFRNPFDQQLKLANNGHVVTLPPRGAQKLLWTVSARAAAAWDPPVWRSDDGQIELTLRTQVVLLTGQLKPIFAQRDEVQKPTTLKQTAALNMSDEWTVVCRFRSTGPSGSPQTLAAKAGGGSRNFAVYLDKHSGVLAAAASLDSTPPRGVEAESGVSLFDGKWHLVAVTYSMHDAEARFYVDGALVKRQSLDGGRLKPNAMPITVGGGFVDDHKHCRAAVRELVIWNRALSAEELSAPGRAGRRTEGK